jgi:6-phosphogluconolactonase
MISRKAALYASVGPVLTHYDLDAENFALIKRGSITLQTYVHYAWPHSSLPVVYVVCSSRTSRADVGSDHTICALKIDPQSGELSMLRKPVSLPLRPLHITTDTPTKHMLVCSNIPSGLWVFRVEPDGSIGAEVKQRPDLDIGIFPHQIRVTPDNRTAIVVTRGNPGNKTYRPHQGQQQDPGALKVFEYNDGLLGKGVSIAPVDGYEFGPRHLDFHPTGPWVYVSLETQNELYVYKREGAFLSRDPLFTRPILEDAVKTPWRQGAGTVHVDPNGRTVYCANRGHEPQPYADKKVVIDADNTLVAYAIDQATGEPTVIQHIGSGGMCPRTFALDPSARMLVAANSESHWVKVGDDVQCMAANLAVFKVLDDGRLELKRKYDVELGPKQKLLWMGIVGYEA